MSEKVYKKIAYSKKKIRIGNNILLLRRLVMMYNNTFF